MLKRGLKAKSELAELYLQIKQLRKMIEQMEILRARAQRRAKRKPPSSRINPLRRHQA
jgi:hypothetical protein